MRRDEGDSRHLKERSRAVIDSGRRSSSMPEGARSSRPAEPGSETAAEGRSALSLQDVTVAFGGVLALDGVSFQVGQAQICGLIGPNGAGKTTLFDVASGARTPDTGTVSLCGVEVSSATAARRARMGLRRTFQRVQTFGWLTVEQNVSVALEWSRRTNTFSLQTLRTSGRRSLSHEMRATVDRTLERCGLTAVRSEYAGSLPIGTARMVELARAIVASPNVLLLDEPASGLSEGEAELLASQIQDIRKESGCAVLLVEHNASFVMEQCDRVIVLSRGTVLADGSPEKIQSDPDVRAAYLGELEAE